MDARMCGNEQVLGMGALAECSAWFFHKLCAILNRFA